MLRKLVGNSPMKTALSPQRKEAMHELMDGIPDLAGTMHILHQYAHCDKILKWLIENDLKGKNLVEFITKKFQGNVHTMVAYVVFKHNKGLNLTRI